MARGSTHQTLPLKSRRGDALLLGFVLAALFIWFGVANAATGKSFKVTSTLDGRTVLPHHIHWYAYAPGTKVRTVDFLIDGKLRWTQKEAPYIYGDQEDDFKTVDRGYLVTSFLSPGLHRFTVRVTATSGPQATYNWSVAGNTLTLTPAGSDPCRVRQFIWAGEWTRVR